MRRKTPCFGVLMTVALFPTGCGRTRIFLFRVRLRGLQAGDAQTFFTRKEHGGIRDVCRCFAGYCLLSGGYATDGALGQSLSLSEISAMISPHCEERIA